MASQLSFLLSRDEKQPKEISYDTSNAGGLFVTATDAGVGKTRIGVELVKLLRERNQCFRP